jgi:hypothetical protein
MNEVQTPLTMEPTIIVEPPTEILLFSPYRRNSTSKPFNTQHKTAQPKFHPYQPKFFPSEKTTTSEFKTHPPILQETFYSGNKLQETFYPKVQTVLLKNSQVPPQTTTQSLPKAKVEKFQIGHWSGMFFSPNS